MGRFINADAFVATGQGILGNNMFAYCRSNPVSRKDPTGTLEECTKDSTEDNNPLNDLGSPSYTGSSGSSSPGKGSLHGNPSQGSGSTNGTVNKTGYAQAPKSAPAGSTYTQISSDGSNVEISKTVYGEYNMPAYRIDYRGHSHGNISGAHIHYFSVQVRPNGIFLNKGPIVQCAIFL